MMDARDQPIEESDHVVVGAGSAGCVVASRLSDDPAVRVLVLEAGTAEIPAAIDDPLAFASFFESDIDWE